MRPHDEFLCLFVVNHFGTFQHLAGVQVVFLVIFHGRKYNTLELPVQQVFRRVAADTGYVGAVAFPRSPFGQDGFPFFVFAIPIVGPFVVKKAAAMGVDGIAVGVFPYFPGYDCGIFRLCFCFCRWQAAKAGQQCKTPNNFPFHLRIRY